MPQIKIDGELIGGYNQLVEYYADKGLVNFKGEKIQRVMTILSFFPQTGLRTQQIQVKKIPSFKNELRKNKLKSLLNLLQMILL